MARVYERHAHRLTPAFCERERALHTSTSGNDVPPFSQLVNQAVGRTAAVGAPSAGNAPGVAAASVAAATQGSQVRVVDAPAAVPVDVDEESTPEGMSASLLLCQCRTDQRGCLERVPESFLIVTLVSEVAKRGKRNEIKWVSHKDKKMKPYETASDCVRSGFLTDAFGVHNLEHVYWPDPTRGPTAKVSFHGTYVSWAVIYADI
jgi:hypothetical protein